MVTGIVVAQAFYKVWHEGLIYLSWKKPTFPDEPNVSERQFSVKCDDDYSELKNISAGTYSIPIAMGDILKCDGVTTAIFFWWHWTVSYW